MSRQYAVFQITPVWCPFSCILGVSQVSSRCGELRRSVHNGSMTETLVRKTAVGAFWELIDEHLGKMEFPPSKRQLAARLDVSPQTITNWQLGIHDLPDRENLEAVAAFVGKTYDDVLRAALAETGYSPGGPKRPRRAARPPNTG